MIIESTVSKRAKMLNAVIEPLLKFFFHSSWAKRFGNPENCDFTIGNPHDTPMDEYLAVLQKWTAPRDKYWYAYKMNEEGARNVVASYLTTSHGMPFRAEDVFLTNGATAALAVVFAAILDPLDEVVFISPPWFMYEAMILNAGGKPVKVKMDRKTFNLDLQAIYSALSPKTRAIIINSPHNPTGTIYPAETLQGLADIVEKASVQNGRRIYLISDEAYRRIIFEGKRYFSPAAFYPHTFIIYTYGKTLLAPGQRIGYIALPPQAEPIEELRGALQTLQMVKGWSFPNALLQHALSDLESLSIDILHLQRKRDRLVGALRRLGYEAHLPDATFYVAVRSPWADDAKFVELLNQYSIFAIPGSLMDFPGYIRLSLTASDDMIDRAIPKFAQALKLAPAGG